MKKGIPSPELKSAYHAGAERTVLQDPHLRGDTAQRCAHRPAGPTPVQPRPSGLRFKTQPERLILPRKVRQTPKVEGRPLTLRWGHYHFMPQSSLHALPQPSDPGLRHSRVTRSLRAQPPSCRGSAALQLAGRGSFTPAPLQRGGTRELQAGLRLQPGVPGATVTFARAPHPLWYPTCLLQEAPLLSALRCRAPEAFCCSRPALPRPVARGPPGPEAKQPC